MKFKVFSKILAVSLLVYLISVFLRSPFLGGQNTSTLGGFIVHLLATVLILNKFKNRISSAYIFLAILLGLWIIEFPIRLVYFYETLSSLPDIIIRTIGVMSGFLYWKLGRKIGIIIVTFAFSLVLFMYFQGWNYWLHYLNFGTITGKVNKYNLPTKFEAFNEQKESITETDFNDKIVLLDFWYTGCGVCFQKFPQLQAAYERYKQDSSVVILAVDKPIEEDKPNQAFEDIKNEGYSFPVVITKEADLAEKWGVIGYPTTFVINPNGQIVYKGNIEGAVRMVDELKVNKN